MKQSEDQRKQSEEKLKESEEKLKQESEEKKQHVRDTIILSIFRHRPKLIDNFNNVVAFVKDFIPETEHVDLIKKYESRQRTRTSDVISTTLTNKSSAREDNNMNSFRFERMSKKSAKQMAKVKFEKAQLTEIIIQQHFNGRYEDYSKYMAKAKEYLNIFHAIFECHFKNSNENAVDEVKEFQPLFHCLLRQLISTLDTAATATTSSSSSSSSISSSSCHSQKFQVEMANRNQLSFKAKVVDNHKKEIEKTINGFTDLAVTVGQNNEWTWDSVKFLIELKPPPTFAKNSDLPGPKNQMFAQLLGLKTMLDNNSKLRNKKVIIGCLTDGFAIYICFLLNGVYYISHYTADPEDYIIAFLFLLCDISTSELDKLIQNSVVTLDTNNEDSSNCNKSNKNNHGDKKNDSDSKANKNNKDNNPKKRKMDPINNDRESFKRPMQIINFKYEDENEQYQNKLDYITRLENEIWGYVHIDEEALQNYVPNNYQNPSDYVMSKFLCDT